MIADEIRDLVDEFNVENGHHLNMGACDVFAHKLSNRVADVNIIDCIEFGMQLGTGKHVWVLHDGRFYDAEVPEGVDDWRDLPFIQRHFEEEDLEDAYIKQGQVVKPGVYDL